MKLLAQVFEGRSMKLSHTIEDTLSGSPNKTSFWPHYLSSMRILVDNYGDVFIHVRRMGFEKPVCQDDGFGCLPRVTGVLIIYSKEKPKQRGCLERQDPVSNHYLLDIHDVFIGNNTVVVLAAESVPYSYSTTKASMRSSTLDELVPGLNATTYYSQFAWGTEEYKLEGVWKGWETAYLLEPWRFFPASPQLETAYCMAKHPDLMHTPRLAPRIALRIHHGKLTFKDKSSAPYAGYIPSSPELCQFTPSSWKTAEMMTDAFAGAELALGTQSFERPFAYRLRPKHVASFAEASYPYPAAFQFASGNGTCTHANKTYLVAAGEGSFFFIPVASLTDSSVSPAALEATYTHYSLDISGVKVTENGYRRTTDQGSYYRNLVPAMQASFGMSDLRVAGDCSAVVGVVRQDGFSTKEATLDTHSYHLFATYTPKKILPGRFNSTKTYQNYSMSILVLGGFDGPSVDEEGELAEGSLASLTPWKPLGQTLFVPDSVSLEGLADEDAKVFNDLFSAAIDPYGSYPYTSPDPYPYTSPDPYPYTSPDPYPYTTSSPDPYPTSSPGVRKRGMLRGRRDRTPSVKPTPRIARAARRQGHKRNLLQFFDYNCYYEDYYCSQPASYCPHISYFYCPDRDSQVDCNDIEVVCNTLSISAAQTRCGISKDVVCTLWYQEEYGIFGTNFTASESGAASGSNAAATTAAERRVYPFEFSLSNNPAFRENLPGNVHAADPDIVLIDLMYYDQDKRTSKSDAGGLGALALRKSVSAQTEAGSCVRHQLVFIPLEPLKDGEANADSAFW
eukprot:tig00000139_g8298.t1